MFGAFVQALLRALRDVFSTRSSRLLAILTVYLTMILAERLNLGAAIDVLRRTGEEWGKDRAAGLAAGLAYYTIFSLAPALLIVTAIAGIVFGEQEVQEQIVAQVETAIGQEGAKLVNGMIDGLRDQQRSGIIATAIGVTTLVFGSIGAFGHLHGSLNAIWGVEVEVEPGLRGSVLFFLRRSVVAFAIVASGGLLLVMFVILNNVLAVVRDTLAGAVPEVGSILPPSTLLVSLAAITVLFAMVFKFLPDINIQWRDVWLGALLTALLFIVGQFFINLYLSTSSLASIYGAAGSIIVILVWVYYSAQIFMLGAEFTKVYTRTYGSHRNETEKGRDSPILEPAPD